MPDETDPTLLSLLSGFGLHLRDLGYSKSAAKKQLQLVRQFMSWLADRHKSLSSFGSDDAEAFFALRREQGRSNLLTPLSLAPLLAYLREIGREPEPPPSAPARPLEVFLGAYRHFLLHERGVVEGTARFYCHVASLFAAERVCPDGLSWAGLRAAQVTSFVRRACAGRSLSSSRQVVSALRCLLRYLRLLGLIELELDEAVLSVAGASPALPRGISADDAQALLSTCDRRRASGKRDFAMLMLLCRLGLRGGEVIGLCLEDIDWRAGEIEVLRKGGVRHRLPLFHDVGEALADYLERARPTVSCRQVFVRSAAPIGPLTATGSLRSLLERACRAAGIAYVNPHRLRHSLASEMLRHGVGLSDIGQVLGHRSSRATSIYARVDVDALSGLSRPWPVTR